MADKGTVSAGEASIMAQRAHDETLRVVEHVLRAEASRDAPGVKITRNAKGEEQIEVHAYEGATAESMKAIGDAARAEFDRQGKRTSIDPDELESLRWYASVGKAVVDNVGERGTERILDAAARLAAERPSLENLDVSSDVLSQGVPHRDLHDQNANGERVFDAACQACQIAAFNGGKAGGAV